MDDTRIRDRFPSIYNGFKEIDRLCDSEQNLFDTLESEVQQLSKNQFVLTSTEEGISEYEKILKIQKSQNESISSRRLKIINRLSDAPPYSYSRLLNRLNSLLGREKYEISLTPEECQIIVFIHTAEPEILVEIQKMFTEILPANIKWVVKTDIICYNSSIEYFGQTISYGLNYILS